MHACRAFLTILSCVQPFLLKRRYVSMSPAISLSSSTLCTVLITLNIFMLWFWLLHKGECCLLEQSSHPIHSSAIVLGLQPRCIAKLPSYRCYLLCLSHLATRLQSCVCECVCTCFLNICTCASCVYVCATACCYTAPSVPHFFVPTINTTAYS